MENLILDEEGTLSPIVVIATILLIATFVVGILYQLVLLVL